MSGYREPDEHDPFVQREDSRGVFNVLVAPVAVGGFMVVKGIAGGAYVIAGIGALILVAVPVMIYVAWHRSY